MSDMTEKRSDFVKDLGDAVRRNPVSAALIGMGVLWLFTSGRSMERAGDLFRRTGINRLPDTAKDVLGNVRSGLGSGADAVADAAGATLSTIHGQGSATLDQASDFVQSLREPGVAFETARDNLSELFRTQPLALGAIGLAIGAGIAAALPNSDIENAYLGEVSETVKNKTAEIAGQQWDKATNLATDVMDAATEEAGKQGLTVEDARAAVASVTDKVGRVVDAAKKSTTDRVG